MLNDVKVFCLFALLKENGRIIAVRCSCRVLLSTYVPVPVAPDVSGGADGGCAHQLQPILYLGGAGLVMYEYSYKIWSQARGCSNLAPSLQPLACCSSRPADDDQYCTVQYCTVPVRVLVRYCSGALTG